MLKVGPRARIIPAACLWIRQENKSLLNMKVNLLSSLCVIGIARKFSVSLRSWTWWRQAYSSVASAQWATPCCRPSPTTEGSFFTLGKALSLPPKLGFRYCSLVGTCNSLAQSALQSEPELTFQLGSSIHRGALLLMRSFFCLFGTKQEFVKTRTLDYSPAWNRCAARARQAREGGAGLFFR